MEHGRIKNAAGLELAWQRLAGRSPCVVFLPGFRSDMTGDKAKTIARLCAERGQAMVLFDYSGHGQSAGRFEDGTISIWTDDALAVIGKLAPGPVLLVGSSMGGWIAARVAIAIPDRIAAFVGIAPAPDFTESLMWQAMTPQEQAAVNHDGQVLQAGPDGDPYPITRALIEDGRRKCILGAAIAITAPVRLLHGQRDLDVPWETSLKMAERVTSSDLQIVLIKDGEHRLSRPQDLALLRATLGTLLDNGP